MNATRALLECKINILDAFFNSGLLLVVFSVLVSASMSIVIGSWIPSRVGVVVGPYRIGRIRLKR